jgi:hypothetical protein
VNVVIALIQVQSIIVLLVVKLVVRCQTPHNAIVNLISRTQSFLLCVFTYQDFIFLGWVAVSMGRETQCECENCKNMTDVKYCITCCKRGCDMSSSPQCDGYNDDFAEVGGF